MHVWKSVQKGEKDFMADHKLPAGPRTRQPKKQPDVELVTPAYAAADRELQAADTIISMVMEAAQDGQFNLHVAKVREQSMDGISEELVEKRLSALDTKRILEAARALEKAVLLKRKLLDLQEKQQPERQSVPHQRIILPEVLPPGLPPGATPEGRG